MKSVEKGRNKFVCSSILYIQRVRRRIGKKFALRNTIFGGGQYLCKYSWNVVKFKRDINTVYYTVRQCILHIISLEGCQWILQAVCPFCLVVWKCCLLVCPFSLVVCSSCLFCLVVWPFCLLVSSFLSLSLSVLP